MTKQKRQPKITIIKSDNPNYKNVADIIIELSQKT